MTPFPTRTLALVLVLSMAPALPLGTAVPDAGTPWEPAPASPSGAAVWGAAASATTMVASTIHSGAFYSHDNGRNWHAAATDVDEGMVAFDPTDPDVGYLAGFGGMDRTTDRGVTWTKVIGESPVQHVAVADDGRVAAAVRVDWDAQLYLSDDRGNSWTVLDGPVPGFSSVYGVAFGDTSQDLIMMTISTTWVSHDGGLTWTETGDGGRALTRTDDGAYWTTGFSGLQRSTDGGHSWTTIDTVPGGNPKILAPRPGGGLYAGSWDGFLITLDDGATWTNIGFGELSFAATALFADPEDPNAIIVGDENMGVNRLSPTADGWRFEGRNAGFPPVQVTALGGSADGSVLVAGGDLGLFLSRDGGTSWSHTGAGIGLPSMHAVGASADGETLYAGGRSWILQAYLQVSRDGGATWDFLAPTPNDSAIASFATHPTDPDVAWAALWVDLDDSHVLETRDRGVTWTSVFTTPSHVGDVAYHEPTATLWAATDTGAYVRPDGAPAFVPAPTPAGGGRFVETTGDMMAAEGQGTSVWRNQAGLPLVTPWADTGDLLTTLAVAEDGTVWAGHRLGTLLVCDGTTTFECVDDSPAPDVHVAWVDPHTGRVWAGTESEGLYFAELAPSAT